MKRILLLLCCITIPIQALAIDIENAKRINRSCALCHGIYGQGTPGTMSPRLAGLPKEYIAKELKYYRDGVREYPPMVLASSIRNMSEKDIEDISEYLAGIDLRNLNLPKIPPYRRGQLQAGREIFMDECKTCHRKTGHGKPKKGIPPVAGQYGSYLFSQMKKFQDKARFHDDDPEDETFDEREDDELDHLVSFLTTLPPHEPLKKEQTFAFSGMSGMMGIAPGNSMIGMTKDGRLGSINTSAVNLDAQRISGRFLITPEGDIVLKPTNQDMRQVAGLSGDFKITSQGLIFIPK
ncbi:MAG: c-type cytochrome [Candidatus Sedimenticola sp. 6PFRAG7]